jgi:tape measure domain-containing protein
MVDTATLQIKVVANGVELTKNQLASLTSETKNAEKATGGLTTAYRGLQAAFAAAGVGYAAKAVIDASTAYSNLNARLVIATGSTENATSAYNALLESVRGSHAPLLETGDLYARLARSTKALGLDQAQLIGITDTIGKSLRISGADAQETASVVKQLGQAFASGSLRGDEFNSIMENGSRIGQVLADTLTNGDIGALRKLGAQGLITSEQMAAAFAQNAAKINDEFSKMPETVSTVMQDIKNEMQNALGSTDASPLVDSLKEMREILKDPATADGLKSLAGGLVTLTTLLAQAAAGFADFGTGLGYVAAKVTGNVDAMDELDHKIESIKQSIAGDKFHAGSAKHWLMSPEEMADTLKKLEDERKQLSMARYGYDGTTPKAATAAVEDGGNAPAVKTGADLEADAATEKRLEKLKELIDKIREQGVESGKTAREVDLLRAANLGAGDAEILAINNAHNLIDATKQKEENIKALTEFDREHTAALLEQTQAEEENRMAQEAALDGVQKALQTRYEQIQAIYDEREAVIALGVANGDISADEGATLSARNEAGFQEDTTGSFGDSNSLDAQLAALDEEYNAIREAKLAHEGTTQEALLELEAQYQERKKGMILANQSMILGNAAAGFDAMAGLAKTFGGEQSKSYQALFAVSKGFAIAKAVVDMQAGISAGIALGWPMSIPAVAIAAAQGASSLSAIKGQNFSGAFDAGGTIPAGSVGLVGEVGPELVSGPANVTSRKDTAAMLGNKGETKIAIFNLMDNKAMIESLKASDDFDEVVINSLTRNQSAAKAAVG